MNHLPARLVVSIDIELAWSSRQCPSHRRRDELIEARRALPRLLELFSHYEVRATWAAVGFLFCRTKDELLASLPCRLPAYESLPRSPYSRLAQIGESEADDPLHYASSLIDHIAETPGQEVASHTFSNFDCFDQGQNKDDFAADLRAATDIARRRGIILRSLVFRDNRIRHDYLDVCRDVGITAYRGNPKIWPYDRQRDDAVSSSGAMVRRWARHIDSVVPVTGCGCVLDKTSIVETPVNIAATRQFRPLDGRWRWLRPMRRRRIFRELDYAAHHGRIFHLWWRLGDIGPAFESELDELRRILERFDGWRNLHRMRSVTMHEVVMGRQGAASTQKPSGSRRASTLSN